MTYNQIMQWQRTSDYWWMMRNLPEDRRSIQFKHSKYGYVPWVNSLWYFIGREFRDKVGEEVKVYKHVNLITGEVFPSNDTGNQPSIYIHTSICAMDFSWKIKYTVQGLRFKNRMSEHTEFVVPPKNMPLTIDNIVEFATKDAQSKYLYSEGYFRDVQEVRCVSKEVVKDMYRTYIKQMHPLNSYNDDDIIKWIRRKYNIDCSGWDVGKAVEIASKYGKQSRLMVARAFDYSFMWEFDGDIDEAEELLYEEMSNYEPNTLFV